MSKIKKLDIALQYNDALELFRAHEPFCQLPKVLLDRLIEDASYICFSPGEKILAPEDGVVDKLFVIERGCVNVHRGDLTNSQVVKACHVPGDYFPLSTMIAAAAPVHTYAAEDEVSCYQLRAEQIFQLIENNGVFALFCNRQTASLLCESRHQLQAQFESRAEEQQLINAPLQYMIEGQVPVFSTPDTSLRDVLGTMQREKTGSLVIVDAQHKPVGIITNSDFAERIILSEKPLTTPVCESMSEIRTTINAHASTYDAMLEMAKHGVRHLPVVDENHALCGVVSERDLYALQQQSSGRVRRRIESASDVETLQQRASDIRQLAFSLIRQGMGAVQLTHLISALNDALTCRVLKLFEMQHDLEGLQWCWLAFGSEGRNEQTFSTDQDNGLVFLLPESGDIEAIREKFLAFAEDVNRALDACGFPLCQGNIMASNPQWCLSLDEWLGQFRRWVSSPHPKALLNASIFFDLRGLYGAFDLEQSMKTYLLEQTTGNTIFLNALSVNALTVESPLGLFRDFATNLEQDKPGYIDLKKRGARLFTDVARVYALSANVKESSTIDRLRHSGAKCGITADEVEAYIDAFSFIQMLRLQNQYEQMRREVSPDNYIDPKTLNDLDRRILKESFKQVKRVQSRLKMDFCAA